MASKSELRDSLTRLATALADLNSPFAPPATRARWSGRAYYAASLGRNASWRRLPEESSEYSPVKSGLEDARDQLEDTDAAGRRVDRALAAVEHIFD